MFHVSLIHKYYVDGRYQPSPPPTEWVEDDPYWEIDRILDHQEVSKGKRHRKEVKYLVKWKGYGPESNLWVSEKDLRNCELAVAEYWAHNK